MQVLIYLIAEPLAGSPEASQHARKRIHFGGRKTQQEDQDHLQLFSDILLDLKQEESFGALHKRLPFHWFDGDFYDIINPFGDYRGTQYHSLWTFDIERDVLYHTNSDIHSQIPLPLLRDRVVSMADMQLLHKSVPEPLALEPNPNPVTSYWKPSIKIDDRTRRVVHRLIRDFHYQWRHIHRNSFNSTTVRALAKALIRLSMLDFHVHEDTGGHGLRGAHVWVTQLPDWEPFETDVERVGNIHVVLCQDIQEGLSMAKGHLLSQRSSTHKKHITVHNTESQLDYMILSVKHIMLCRATSPTMLINTAPQPLVNGNYEGGASSQLALDYLVWATASARPLIDTPLQSLPVEVQDMILSNVCAGTVQAAKIGCMLGIGSPFVRREDLQKATLEERHRIRPTGFGVESLVWFGDHKSGIVYLERPHWY